MPITIPIFPNPISPSAPLTTAYGWIAGLSLDMSKGTGRLTVNVHPTEADWQATPAGQVTINLGQKLHDATITPPVAEVDFPNLATLMADTAFASAFAVVQAKLESYLSTVPQFAGAVNAP